MSTHVYTQNSKEKIVLNPKPFASGGEGSLYKIVSPQTWTNFVVKIYHPEKLTPIREQKINYLLKHRPDSTAKDSIVWVSDIVKGEKGEFKGFVMPFKKGEKLEILCSTKLPRKLENTWFRFHPEAKGALDLRLKLCYNLAVAIHQVHACGRYVLVDLKPDNVIVTPEGLVSLVDMDSIEVVENGVKLYDAPVATPEYTPPEKYLQSDTDPTQQQTWDCFSLAVIFYKLLMQIHPFAGSFAAPYELATNLSEKIEKGLFVHNKNLKSYQLAIPPLHKSYLKLNKELQQLFETCFVDGHQNPAARPTAAQWCSTIMQTLDFLSLNRTRNRITQLVKMPESSTQLVEIKVFVDAPDAYLEKNLTTKILIDTTDLETRKKKNKELTLLSRKINLGLLFFGIPSGVVLIIDDANLGVFILGATIWLCTMLVLKTFTDKGRENNFILFGRTATKEWELYLQQETIVDGIKKHLNSFFELLKKEYDKIFPPQLLDNQDNINQAIDLELLQLEDELKLLDKTAQQLAESEEFEYNSLKETYNKALRTNPYFVNATSLDAELASIDFAKQSKLEFIHKDLDRELKKENSEFKLSFDIEQQKIKKLNKEADSKIATHKAKLDLAEKQERQKLLVQLQRQLLEQNANVNFNKDFRLTMFKEEIVAFLKKNNISNMTQITDIKPNGQVVLEGGKTISIAPLRYYQIHELVEWWSSIMEKRVVLSEELSNEITKRYERELQNYKKTVQNRLNTLLDEIEAKQKELRKKWKTVLTKLEQSAKQPIAEIEEQYKEQILFLKNLISERKELESKIHERYEQKFEAILKDAQDKADKVNIKIKGITKNNTINDGQLELYQKNLRKYQLGLLRLKEEQQRLELIKVRHQATLLTKAYYEKLNVKDYILQMFFLKKV